MNRWQDTPAAVFMRLMADLMVLNIVVVICCFPVITIGASLSAMYAVLFEREKDDGAVAVLRTFFRAFIRNFPKATALELIVLLISGIAAGDFWYATMSAQPVRSVFYVVGTIVVCVAVIIFLLAFAQQSIYQNTVSGYLKNSASLAFVAPGQLLLALAAWVVPWFLGFMDQEMLSYLGFFLMLWGFSFPGWVTAKLFWKVFQKIDSQEANA